MDRILSVLSEDSKALSRISATTDIGPSDEFLLAKASEDEAFRLRYDQLLARIISDVDGIFDFKSMAYRYQYEYSLKNHTHPYSQVDFFPKYTYEQICAMYKDKSQCSGRYAIPEYLGTIEICRPDETGEYRPVSTDIYMPKFEDPVYAEPDIGEVRFLARPVLPGVTGNPRLVSIYKQNDMLYDSELDGYWIYPLGQTVQCPASEFPDACVQYGPTCSKTDTSFTVPLLNRFFKPCASSNAMSNVAWQNGLPAHSDHRIDQNSISFNSTLYADVKVPTTISAGSNGIHSGKGYCDPTHQVAMISAEIRNVHIKCQNQQTEYSPASLDVETYPRHQNMITMIYIGKRIK